MVKHEPWQFFIFRFTDKDGKRHTVSVGAASMEDGIELLSDMYVSVRNLRITQRGEE
jgi:hypothetical protein